MPGAGLSVYVWVVEVGGVRFFGGGGGWMKAFRCFGMHMGRLEWWSLDRG